MIGVLVATGIEIVIMCMHDSWMTSPGLGGIVVRALVRAVGGEHADVPLPEESKAWACALLKASGISLDKTYDVHCHVVGRGHGNTGCCANARFSDPCHPVLKLKMWVFQAAAGVLPHHPDADAAYMARLRNLLRTFRPRGEQNEELGPFACLLAFDKFHSPEGLPLDERSGLYTPNEYVMGLADETPDLFVPVASIHPYRPDAVDALHAAAAAGACIVKWLPNSQGIDPSDPKCAPFYAAMVELDMALLTHTGDEHTVDAGGLNNALGNPLLLRAPLAAGVKVIAAHCGSEGMSVDLDAPSFVRVPSFDLWLRLMDENPRLYGDIAALTSFKRIEHTRTLLLERRDLLPRLLYGSDYPVPAVNAVVRLSKLVDAGLLPQQAVPHLRAAYAFNPILFDVLTKLAIGFPSQVFDTNLHTFLPRLRTAHLSKLASSTR